MMSLVTAVSQHVAGKPSLCEKQSVQLVADDLVVQQSGLVDGERQLKTPIFTHSIS